MRQAPFLQSLTQRLTRVRRWYIKLRRNCSFEALQELYVVQPQLYSVAKLANHGLQLYTHRLRDVFRRTPVIFAASLILLTAVIGHSWYNQPQVKNGSTATVTVQAPSTKVLENKYATQSKRDAIALKLAPVLMIDKSANNQVGQKLETIVAQGNSIRNLAGSFPYFDTIVLSVPTQRYLRSTSNNEWEAFRFAVVHPTKQSQSQPLLVSGDDIETQTNSKLTVSSALTQALSEVETYRLTTSEQNISTLTEKIALSRQRYKGAKGEILKIINQSNAVYNEKLVDLTEEDWKNTQTIIKQIAERILAQGISPGLPNSVLTEAVRLNVQSSSVPKEAQELATKVLLNVLQPNLITDGAKTQENVELAAADVKPVMVEVKQNAIIVRRGEKITDWHLLVLESYGLIDREVNWVALLLLSIAISGAILVFAAVDKRVKYLKRTRDRILILLLTLSTPLVLTMGTYYTTWSAVSLLLGSFYGTRISLTVIGLLTVLLPLNFGVSKIALFAGATGAFLGSYMAHKRRSREELALLGIGIAVTQGCVFLVLTIIFGGVSVGKWYSVLTNSLLFACSGLCWSIVALGLSSYLEQLFDLVTPIRLAELANPNRPLLKSLAAKTPGTFQHTLFVSSLAEAAACKLGCNVELVRAGTLYHDIGKMHDPKAFIENQMGGPNKHDTEINDPWLSAEIIKKHVSEGLVIARKHRLPTAIQAFIPEHQGTMQIAYFYHQAQQIAKENPFIEVNEADFRYDGPIPQSRETAIVMLADSCEAALRSLKDTTYEQALAVVNNILRGRWQDNQLIDSGLTRAEMTQIAEIFVKVWQQFHHKRIAYPKLKPCKD
ncbi:7TM receptor with intracellular metal dependent phosphohydrolase [Rivularia sp. IAM M-261]|nr:7TM receptor with intracellular metal dependent phosphohydrolase [Calothrix sp. PCC 7716]GJD21487.1 7TM receptor with intracellular metal dependent phosphohydrolase [Rivularia sp. IAM M-261]